MPLNLLLPLLHVHSHDAGVARAARHKLSRWPIGGEVTCCRSFDDRVELLPVVVEVGSTKALEATYYRSMAW